jgi:hypothetical protein
MLTVPDEKRRVQRGAYVFASCVVAACGALAFIGLNNAPLLAGSIAIGLAVWVGIASLFSP